MLNKLLYFIVINELKFKMTEIPNSKQLAFGLIWDLDIVILDLFEVWCL